MEAPWLVLLGSHAQPFGQSLWMEREIEEPLVTCWFFSARAQATRIGSLTRVTWFERGWSSLPKKGDMVKGCWADKPKGSLLKYLMIALKCLHVRLGARPFLCAICNLFNSQSRWVLCTLFLKFKKLHSERLSNFPKPPSEYVASPGFRHRCVCPQAPSLTPCSISPSERESQRLPLRNCTSQERLG